MVEKDPMAPSESPNDLNPKSSSGRQGKRSLLRGAIYICGNLILPLIMAGVIVWTYNWLIETAPEAERGARKRRPRLAEFIEVNIADHDATISAFGSVTPARMVELKPRVNGSIDAIADTFEPGGVFNKDEAMIWIDPERFRLTQEITAQELVRAEEDIKALHGQVDEAKAALSVEIGRSEVARQEYELMGITIKDAQKLSRLLRKPQLAQAQSVLRSAKAKIAVAEASKQVAATRLEEAKLDFARTTVKAPFNATVMERFAEVGEHASTSSSLAKLCSTDTAWIEVSVPSGSLSWIDLPPSRVSGKNGGGTIKAEASPTESRVRIYHDHVWGEGVYREARIVRLLPDRSQTGRQARLLLAVDDPFCLNEKSAKTPKLLINSFVRIEIRGKTLASVAKIHRNAVHEGNVVWLVTAENKLELRQVKPIWGTKEHVFISAEELAAGERLITSAISTPVPGLALRPRASRKADLKSKEN